MHNSQNKKTLQIVLIVLIAVLTLGIGYASITAVNLIINGNATGTVAQENFKVYFVPTADTPSLTGNVTLTGSATIDSEDNTIAHFNVSGLTKEGDYAIATYTIINNSEGVGAEITLNLTSSNTEYFKVTETVSDTQLQAGDTTTGTIKVEMIKTPIENEISTNVIGTLTAKPIDNENATNSTTITEVATKPYIYTSNLFPTATNINQAVPNGVNQYTSFNNPGREAFGHPASVAHIIEDGIIKESYVAFEIGGKVYYIRGAVDEFIQEERPVYDANVAELKKAFGGEGVWQNYCSESGNDRYLQFYCYADGLSTTSRANGDVNAYGNGWHCYVDVSGFSYCAVSN